MDDLAKRRSHSGPAEYRTGDSRWQGISAARRLSFKLLAQQSLATLVTLVGVVCASMLVLPMRTVVTKYPNDLFVFLDGAHRITWGHVPNVDFYSALGPLVYMIPALGLWLTGSLGAAMPVGLGLFLVLCMPLFSHVVASRLTRGLGLAFSVFILLIMAAPMNLGESVTSLSFAMFYNRLGWGLLALLLLMHLEPLRPSRAQIVWDAACASALVLVLLYMKVSYGLVAMAFVGLQLFSRSQRGWAGIALAGIGVFAFGIDLVWGGTRGYIEDIWQASRVNGAVRGGFVAIVGVALRHLADLTLLGIVLGLAMWRRPRALDACFFCLCVVTGLLLINQNFQSWGIITIHAAAVVAAAGVMRSLDERQACYSSLRAGTALLALGMLAPTIVHNAAALTLHSVAAVFGRATFLPTSLSGIVWAEMPHGGDIHFLRRYRDTVHDGAELIAEAAPAGGTLVVLDFVNPFSAALNMRPARGDSAWNHWDRNINREVFLPVAIRFSDAQMVMAPKTPAEVWTARGMMDLYRSYLDENYVLLGESRHWFLYRRK